MCLPSGLNTILAPSIPSYRSTLAVNDGRRFAASPADISHAFAVGAKSQAERQEFLKGWAADTVHHHQPAAVPHGFVGQMPAVTTEEERLRLLARRDHPVPEGGVSDGVIFGSFDPVEYEEPLAAAPGAVGQVLAVGAKQTGQMSS